MKLLALTVSGVLVGVLGCGGAGSKYKPRQAESADPKLVVFGLRVYATGDQDPLDSVIVASTGVGCVSTKARYDLQGDNKLFSSEGKCGEMDIEFTYSKPSNMLMMTCPVAFGPGPCRDKFAEILGMANDARYIK